jgi:hypothetical protein
MSNIEPDPSLFDVGHSMFDIKKVLGGLILA